MHITHVTDSMTRVMSSTTLIGGGLLLTIYRTQIHHHGLLYRCNAASTWTTRSTGKDVAGIATAALDCAAAAASTAITQPPL